MTASPADVQRTHWKALVSNSNWNFAAFVVAVLANFLALPVVVRNIGVAQFGAGGIVLGVLAPLMLVGTVLGQACVREISAQVVDGRIEDARRIYWTALWMCGLGCSLVFVGVGLAGPFVVGRFLGGEQIAAEALRRLCLIAVAGWTAQQFVQVLQAAIAATQRYRALALLNAASSVVSAGCLVAASAWWPTVGGFLAGTAAGFAITAAWSLWQVRRHADHLFPATRPDRTATRRILDFGRWQAVAQIAGAVALQTDRLVLGATSALSIVGQLNVATRLQEVVYMGVLKITEVLYPHFSASAARPVAERVPLLLMSSWLTNAIAAAALVPLVPLSAALVALWVGPEAVPAGAPILRTLVCAGLVGSGTNALTYFMLGQGYAGLLARVNLAHCAIVIVASIVLLLSLGPLAAGAGFLIANAVRLGYLSWQLSAMTARTMSAWRMTTASMTPIAAGLALAWLPWPVNAVGGWGGLAAAYALLALLTATGAVILSLCFFDSRSLVLRIAGGLRYQILDR